MRGNEKIHRPGSGVKLGLHSGYQEKLGVRVRGHVFFRLEDAVTHKTLAEWDKQNIIVLDAGILAARLFKDKDEPANSLNMLAVGTGALGSVLNPDVPPPEQRQLNAELARKPFASTTFRDSQGAASAIPTNVVDFTTTFGESEAVGPLNEMGLMATISNNPLVLNPNPNLAGQGGQPYDPTVDVTQYDNMVNYLTFAAVTKPARSILTITWRLTF